MEADFRQVALDAEARLKSIDDQLLDPVIVSDQTLVADLLRRRSKTAELGEFGRALMECEEELAEAREMLSTGDADMVGMAKDEVAQLEKRHGSVMGDIRSYVASKAERDDRACWVEVRAGTGGGEASIFAADLARMYLRYAERQGWQAEIVNSQETEVGGLRLMVMHIDAEGAYTLLRHESGVHRVQRVPATESQGRVHTSACSVVVLPEADAEIVEGLEKSDLRVDTFRASGAGGQHVNKTDSAIRITHLPTGLKAECQSERSQHQNRARALAALAAKLQDRADQQRRQQLDDVRRKTVGSGDRSEKIRTYNFPANRVTDHRIKLSINALTDVMAGDLHRILTALDDAAMARVAV